jgi:hypothetical protein
MLKSRSRRLLGCWAGGGYYFNGLGLLSCRGLTLVIYIFRIKLRNSASDLFVSRNVGTALVEWALQSAQKITSRPQALQQFRNTLTVLPTELLLVFFSHYIIPAIVSKLFDLCGKCRQKVWNRRFSFLLPALISPPMDQDDETQSQAVSSV